MKAALLFLTMGCAALVCGTGYAATADDANPQRKVKPPVQQTTRGPATRKKGEHESVTLPKPASPRRTPKGPKPSVTKNAMSVGPRGSNQRVSQPRVGLSESHGVVEARSVRPSTVRPVAPLPNNARHHGANSPTVGGSRSTTVASTAVLNGRAVSRRP